MNSLLITSAISNLARYNPAPEPEARNDPEIAAKTLGLEEITDSDASSLLSSLITSKKSAHESQIEFSNLSINPERVAKVARHKALLHHGPRLANFCQVVPERIFSVAFHPGDKLVAAAGDKWGKVMENIEKQVKHCFQITTSRWDCGIVRTSRAQRTASTCSSTTPAQSTASLGTRTHIPSFRHLMTALCGG